MKKVAAEKKKPTVQIHLHLHLPPHRDYWTRWEYAETMKDILREIIKSLEETAKKYA